jgi:uncharacterized membrane protein
MVEVAAPMERLVLVDRLRGLVIVLMVLDHVREYFNREAQLFAANDVAQTTPLLFASRWVTHLCAPTFVLLAGVSIYLQMQRGRRGWPLSRFLLSRGIWLIFLELTYVSFAFNFAYPFFLLQVIWAIGFGMILMAGLTWLPARASLLIGSVLIVGGQMLTPAPGTDPAGWSWLITLMLRPGQLGLVPNFVPYPALPWFGILSLGFGMGGVFTQPAPRRDRTLVGIGVLMLAAFLVIRVANGYGDPAPWVRQPDAARTMLSFLNVSKYPPSLDYALATLGTSLALAPLVARIPGAPGRLMLAFGRTPLLTYLAHIPLVHLLAIALGAAMGVPAATFFHFIGGAPRLAQAGWGLSIGWTYVVWLSVVLALWPLAAWFARLRQRRRDWWLSYL